MKYSQNVVVILFAMLKESIDKNDKENIKTNMGAIAIRVLDDKHFKELKEKGVF